MTLTELRDRKDARQPIKQTSDGEGYYACSLNRDAGMSGGYFVCADGIKPGGLSR
jgi:hypothetical protein